MLAEMVTWFAAFCARWWTYRELVSSLFVSIAAFREFSFYIKCGVPPFRTEGTTSNFKLIPRIVGI